MADPITGDDTNNDLTGTELGDTLLGLGGADTLSGLGGDDTLDGGSGADTMTGGAGGDAYYVENTGDRVIEIDEAGVDTVNAAISYVLGANVEDLILTGRAIAATGNSGANKLLGNASANELDGKGGADFMAGYDGNDTYHVDNAGDVVDDKNLTSSSGRDTVIASIDYVLGDGIENLTLVDQAISGTGNELKNLLNGNAEANLLDGKAGGDVMKGGKGDDTYLVDSSLDKVIELAGDGTDTVITSVNHVLAANVENLILEGDYQPNGTGNALDNHIVGNLGINTLDGGLGADVLEGLQGNDKYIVDNPGDMVVEEDNAFGGTDSVFASINYTLGIGVEYLVLTGTANINGTGNGDANNITGNSGNNVLSGGNSAGNDYDVLAGGAGDDTYIFEHYYTRVVERRDAGIDTIRSTLSLSLSTFANVEKLVLLGHDNINGFGNNLDNVITGTDGNNLLNGMTGADTLIGGAGNDTYAVYDKVPDTLVELAGGGTDTVYASHDFVLAKNFENLTLFDGAKSATGNSAENVLIGNFKGNILDGMSGADRMQGLHGDDIYHVDNVGDVVDETGYNGNDTVITTIDYVLPDLVENLTLTGRAKLATGNALNNMITGNALANTLDGSAGADKLIGGAGNDVYYVDNSDDRIVELADGGSDTVFAATSTVLSAEIEKLVLQDSAANGTGNAQDNLIIGTMLANRLDGGAGADRLEGGAGDDTYVVDNAGDKVVESAVGGTDTVEASISWVLGSTTENLLLKGKKAIDGTGNALANTIIANDAGNQLSGLGGNDALTGGRGDDVMHGGGGDDQLVGNGGKDQLFGDAGNDVLDGGAGADTLSGDAGNDTLDGGAGADTLRGGLGDDRYVVGEAGDVVTEAAGAGRDLVTASLDWTLAANLEDLTLTGSAIRGTGNRGDNTITGNDSANVLAGGGGGRDTLVGGLGDDTYLVDGTSVTVVEKADGGTDRMVFTISGTLGSNVEVGIAGGTSAVAITGSAGSNLIGGNGAANVLDGGAGDDTLFGQAGADTLRGGAGNDFLYGGSAADTLTGGAGSDQFALGITAQQGVETITDFVSGTDTLLVINPYVSGRLLPGGLVFGTEAREEDDIAIYDKASGNLYADPDGNGTGAKVLVAKLAAGTNLAASDIFLIDEGSFFSQISGLEQLLLI